MPIKGQHKDLRMEDITIGIDSREQLPLEFPGIKTERVTLVTSDYSVIGLERHVAVERKSLSDLLMCIGADRDRFERELDRLRAYPVCAVVVEASWNDLMAGMWRSKLCPSQVTSSVIAWTARYRVPFILAGDRSSAAQIVAKLLFYAARDRWVEAVSFIDTLRLVS